MLIGMLCLAGDPSEMPELQGKQIDRAKQMVRLRGGQPLEGVFYISPQNWRQDIRPNRVYLQTPIAGQGFPATGEAGLWRFEKASVDRPSTRTPSVVGLTKKEASLEIKQSGLVLMNKTNGNDDWVVTDQFPRAKDLVYTGTSILLLVSEPDGLEASE